MKKPKDVMELASRLSNAATTPLMGQAPEPQTADQAMPAPLPEKRRKAPNRGSVAVFLRLAQPLYEHYDAEAVRRTRETGRGVTVQQVILDRLSEVQL